MDTLHPIAVLAHEPGVGWITYATRLSPEVAARAELDALAEGYDAVMLDPSALPVDLLVRWARETLRLAA